MGLVRGAVVEPEIVWRTAHPHDVIPVGREAGPEILARQERDALVLVRRVDWDPMQVDLVSGRLALRDLFTARRVTLRVFLAVVETCVVQLPRLSWPLGQRATA